MTPMSPKKNRPPGGTGGPRKAHDGGSREPSITAEVDNVPPGVGLWTGKIHSNIMTSRELNHLPDPQPLIDEVLYRDSLAWLHGKAGHGKSFVALDWAGCVAGGIPWQRREVPHPGPVVYIVAEGAAGIRQRVRAWEQSVEYMDGVYFLPVAVQLLDEECVTALIDVLTDIKPVLVIFDTQARVTVGAEENSAKDMGAIVARLDAIREATGACVLTVHHEGRAGDNMRGSTAMEGAAETVIRCTKDGAHIRLDCVKQKNVETFPPLLLRLVPVGESAVLQSPISGVGLSVDLAESEERIMDAARDVFGTTGASPTDYREATGLSKTSTYRALNRLVAKGLLRNVGSQKRPLFLLPGEADSESPA